MTSHSSSGFDLAPPNQDERSQLEARLTPAEAEVLLRHGTEAPFCGLLLENKARGAYACRLCGLPLFRSGEKFDSGTGWPSFTEPYDDAHLRLVDDHSHGVTRTETRCARCDSHQGHVFPDGPPPTGRRFCINSLALTFITQGERLPDPLGREDGLRETV